MTEAERLFSDLKTQGLVLLQQWLVDGQEENLWLDFKRLPGDTGPLAKNERTILSVALSGFSNSDGGVIVWGADCRRGTGPNAPDELQSLNPISMLDQTYNQLNRISHQFLSPGLNGVEHIKIDDGTASDRGFLCTYVPRWDGEPQMAIGPNVHGYYCRINDSFKEMEHYQIADRFHRRPQPKLEVHLGIQGFEGAKHNFEKVRFTFSIANIGLGIAVYPALAVSESTPKQHSNEPVQPFGRMGAIRPMDKPGGWFMVNAPNHVCIYPKTSMMALGSWVQIKPGMDFALDYEVYCDGYSATGHLEMDAGTIKSKIANS